MVFLWLAACAALVGIDELEGVPAGFPVELEGQDLGHVTRSPTGQVAVDVAFFDVERARAGWKTLIAEAESKGFAVTDRGHVDKRDRVVLEGPQGKLELSCCAGRADRRQLVLVSWWAPSAP